MKQIILEVYEQFHEPLRSRPPSWPKPPRLVAEMWSARKSLVLGLVVWAVAATTCLPVRAEEVASGITEAVCDVILSPSVAGLVSAWKFKEGDFVKEGEVVIELDNRMEALEVERRRLTMENRKTDWEALQTLSKKSSISLKKEDLEKAEMEYKIAVTEHQMAVEQLRKRSLVAPCAGYVVEFARDVGEACDEYQPLVRLADTRQCYFVSNVEAKAAGRLKLGDAMKLEIETAATPTSISGQVVFLSPVVDPASGLRKVKVLFDNADGKINPGVAGKMRF